MTKKLGPMAALFNWCGLDMVRTENLCLLSAPHQQLLSAPCLLYITLSVSALHRNPKVSPPNSNGDLHSLT